jgi:hypothetical protein
MKTTFSKNDLGCLIDDKWDIFGSRILVTNDGLLLTKNGDYDSVWFHPEPEKSVLPFPFTLEQFRTFCDWHPSFRWMAIESIFTNDNGSLDEAAIDRLNSTSGASELVRAVLATKDGKNQSVNYEKAWVIHEKIDLCKADIQRWERLKQNAPTPSEAIAAEGKLTGLHAELTMLLRQLSGSAQAHPQAATSQLQSVTEEKAAQTTTVPVVAPSKALEWTVIKPERFKGYTAPLYRLIASAYREGGTRPTARDVVEAWRINKPAEVAKMLPDGFDYYDAKGDTKQADLEVIRKAIYRMTRAR